MKISKGDTVLVIAGKDRGKTGTVLKVLPGDARVVVAGANMKVKHVRKTQQSAGQRITFEGSMHVSNVMLLDPKTGKPTRVGYKIDEKGRKTRIARVSGAAITGTAAAKKETKAAAAGKDVKDAKEKEPKKNIKVDATESQATGEAPKKAPFWKKLGFGSEAMEGEDPTAQSTPGADQAARSPDQTHTRATSRGS